MKSISKKSIFQALNSPSPSISEFEILHYLEINGPSSAREIRDGIPSRRRAYSTLMTILSQMLTKGLIANDRSDGKLLFRSLICLSKVRKDLFHRFISDYFDQDIQAFHQFYISLPVSANSDSGELSVTPQFYSAVSSSFPYLKDSSSLSGDDADIVLL